MDTFEYHNGSGYQDVVGPPGPTHFLRAGPGTIRPRGVGDLLADTSQTITWDGDWLYPTFENGWSNYGAEFAPARFRKTAGGLVYIEGLIRGGSPTTIAFRLPTGYRPIHRVMTSNVNTGSNVHRVDVTAEGGVIPYDHNSYASLQIIFYADL